MKLCRDLYILPIFNFTEKLIVLVAFVTLGIFAVRSNSFLIQIIGVIILGLMYCHAQSLQHESIHGTALKNKNLNYLVGIILGLPLLVSFTHYRDTHRRHHALLGTPRDHDFFSYQSLEKMQVGLLLQDLFGYSRVRNAFKNFYLALGFRSDVEKTIQSSRVQSEYFLMMFILITVLLLSLAFQSFIILKLYIIPFIFIASPAYFLTELPEHLYCDKTTQDFYLNTRTIKGSWFSFWFTNGNNFHVEHHKNARLSTQELPAVFLKTAQDNCLYRETSYPEFYRKVIRSCLKRSANVAAEKFS